MFIHIPSRNVFVNRSMCADRCDRKSFWRFWKERKLSMDIQQLYGTTKSSGQRKQKLSPSSFFCNFFVENYLQFSQVKYSKSNTMEYGKVAIVRAGGIGWTTQDNAENDQAKYPVGNFFVSLRLTLKAKHILATFLQTLTPQTTIQALA